MGRDFTNLNRGSLRLVGSTRVRLATVKDLDFLTEMSALAGSTVDTSQVDHPNYQRGVQAGLNGGAFFSTVGEAYNECAESSLLDAFVSAGAAASIDLVATKSGVPVGAVRIGAPNAVVVDLLNRDVDEHQVLSLMFGVAKIKALGVSPDHRGAGIGEHLLRVALKIVFTVTHHGLAFAECKERMLDLNAKAGLRRVVSTYGGLPVLNVWPYAGPHIVTRRIGQPDDGPYIATEPGYQLVAATRPTLDATVRELLKLNQLA